MKNIFVFAAFITMLTSCGVGTYSVQSGVEDAAFISFTDVGNQLVNVYCFSSKLFAFIFKFLQSVFNINYLITKACCFNKFHIFCRFNQWITSRTVIKCFWYNLCTVIMKYSFKNRTVTHTHLSFFFIFCFFLFYLRNNALIFFIFSILQSNDMLTLNASGKIMETSLAKNFSTFFFSLSFVCIGMDTRLKDIISRENRRVLWSFVGAQLFNIVVTLTLAWLMFGIVKPAVWG